MRPICKSEYFGLDRSVSRAYQKGDERYRNRYLLCDIWSLTLLVEQVHLTRFLDRERVFRKIGHILSASRLLRVHR